MTYDFSDKIAFVTGGTRGIGKIVVQTLLDSHASVVTAYTRSGKEAETLCREAASRGEKLHVLQCDVSDPEAVDAAVHSVEERFGRLDFLVNNAGITSDGLVVRMKNDQWMNVINTNLGGVFYCTRAALKCMMKQRYGRIVNISSVVGLHGNAGQANYAASKAGIIGFSKSVAKEMGSRNILVNVVAPGYIETDMVSGIPGDVRSRILEAIPQARYGTPADVARVVCFLLSDDSGYINGAVIDVNGGME